MHRTGGKDIRRTYLTGAQLLSLCFWSTAFKLVLLVQPSSAAAERVFSLLRQSSSLEDYIETSLMLQYNRLSFPEFL